MKLMKTSEEPQSLNCPLEAGFRNTQHVKTLILTTEVKVLTDFLFFLFEYFTSLWANASHGSCFIDQFLCN